MSVFIIQFPDLGEEVLVNMLEDKAPKTCKGFWDAIKDPIHTSGKHAMYTGREISVQLPPDLQQGSMLQDPPPENLTCFPLPGDILFTYMPKHAFGGIPVPVFDIGVFYGRDARTFFPMGWLPGNLFARVDNPRELEKLAKIGQHVNENGKENIVFIRK